MGTGSSNAYEFDVDYLARADEVLPSGVSLFVRQMEQADDGLFTLVVLSGMRDAWDLLRDHTELFRRKIARVVIMGGIEVSGTLAKLSEEGFLVPDTASNNAFDMEAANCFYRELQQQSIPMTIVSRWAAYAAKLPLSLYDRMARTLHPVALRLQRVQQKSLQHLWARANMAPDDPAREGLPPRCNKAWFSQVFLGGQGLDRTGKDSIWDRATTFQPYDCIAVLGALPGMRDRYFDPVVFPVHGMHGITVHEVMGLSAQISGVRDPDALCSWLEEALLEGVMTDTVQRALSKQNSSKYANGAQVHYVRAFAQTCALQAPQMQPARLAVMKHLINVAFTE